MQERTEFNIYTAEAAVKDKRVVGLEPVVNSGSNSASLRYNLVDMAKEIECVQKKEELLEKLEDSALALFFFRKSTQHVKDPNYSRIFCLLLADFQDKKRNLEEFIGQTTKKSTTNHHLPETTMYPQRGYRWGTQHGTSGVHSRYKTNSY